MSALAVAIFTVITNIDTDATHVGNNGLVQALVCKQCEPNHLVAHGEDNFCNW